MVQPFKARRQRHNPKQCEGSTIYASFDDDIITNTANNVSIDADDGNDTVSASGLANTIHGGKGDDSIYTADDKNLLYGDDGNNPNQRP